LIDALVCVQPGELKIQQRPAPQAESGHVLVRPRRIGICGTDYHIYEGNQPFLAYPRVMGHELAVEVVENDLGVGPAVGTICVVNPYLSCGTCHACQRGKPNCCMKIAVLGVHRDGGMTGLLSLPPGNLIVADGLTVDECAMVEFLAIGAHAVRRGAVRREDRVLILGAGPIGLGAALFASLTGAEITVMERDAERLATASRLFKVHHTILAESDVTKAVADATGGDGYDVVFDATGNRRSIEAGFQHVAHGGNYVLVSVVQGDITFTDADFHRREATLLGSRNATTEDFERVITAIRERKIDSKAWITHRTTLEGAVEALPRWATEKTGLIKAVIEVA
jgi:2-desacetyl-2-hydroxyethyl bacteriochlorophyllide A dehydrogenase